MDKLLCLFFCASVGHLLQIDATDVQWPSGYSVEWSMREESSGFSMNVKQYTSKSKNAFRWDVFGGENTFIIKQNDQNVSELYYYFLTTNETSTNVMYCFFEPSIFDTIDNSGLPDPKGFSRSETVTVNGAQLQKWTFTSSFGESKREYTLWINMGTETEGPIPVKAHYQEYVGGTQEELFSATRLTVDYYNYIPKEPEESVWDGPKNIECLADYGAYNDTMMGFMGNAIVPVALRSSITSVSPVEKKGKGLKINRPSGSSALPFPYTDEEVQAMAANLPKSFDWRKHGAVTEVKNQMHCGSCWIFGVIGSLEGAYFIKTGNLLVLSEQALMDCCWKLNFEDQNYTVGGCQGGFTEPAMDCIKHYGGVPMTVDYGNYKEINGRCSMSGMKLVAPIKSFVHVAQNKDAVKVALYHHGPLAVSIATPWQFEYYVNGVISADNPGPIDHTVLLVGYGTLDGVDYWTIKNSWGEGWGLRGFGLISAANDNLSLLDEVYYPVLE